MKGYEKLEERFKEFKKITNEESKIASVIQKNVTLGKHHKLLDIGSNEGKISHALQKNDEHITLIDINEFHIQSKAKFITSKWEEICLE